MPPHSGDRPINLFRQNHSRQLMRHRHRRKRQQQIRPRPPLPRQSVRAADDEHHVAPLFHLRDESRRIEFFSQRIKKDLSRRRMLRPRIEAPRVNLSHLTRRVSRGAFNVLFRHRIRMRIPRLADVVEENLHFKNVRMRSTASIRFSNELAIENRK